MQPKNSSVWSIVFWCNTGRDAILGSARAIVVVPGRHSPLDYWTWLQCRHIDWLADQLTDWLIDERAAAVAADRAIICYAINIFADDADSFSKPYTPHPPFQRWTASQGSAERPTQLINSATECVSGRRSGSQATDWRWNGIWNVPGMTTQPTESSAKPLTLFILSLDRTEVVF